jgi:hypothetical protein
MALEKISLQSPTEGWVAAPFSMPGVGEYDQIRNLEAVYPGTAVSFKASTDQLDFLSVYKYGNVLARPEFGGVVATYSNSPDNLNPICTTNAAVISILKAGRAGIMLAPGEVIERDQYLEPIPSGAYQGLWRAAAGPATAYAQAMQPYDDSANAAGDLPGRIITALILPRAAGSGLLGALGPSLTLTGTTTETEYTIGSPPAVLSRTIPANSVKVGDRFRIVFAIEALNGASGATLFKAYLNGKAATTSRFYSSISTTPSSGDVVQVAADLYIAALSGSNNVFLSGMAVVGAPGTATARSLGISCTMDVTVDNTITVSCTPNNNADQSELTFLSVEKLA